MTYYCLQQLFLVIAAADLFVRKQQQRKIV